MRDAFPINTLKAIQATPEVCNIYCATANPVEVIVAETEQGRGVLGVIDGSSPKAWKRRRMSRSGTGSCEKSATSDSLVQDALR